MKLMTKGIINKLPNLYSNEKVQAKDVPVIVKYFTPDAQCTWHITEGEQQGDDWMLFGLCDLGMGEPELGYVRLSDLEEVRGKLGLPVERDLHYHGTLADAMEKAGL